MATTASSALLLVGAIVGLEALGLIFRGSPPQPRIASIQTGLEDPEALAAALLWQRQEEGQAEAWRKAEEELRRFEAAGQDAAGQAEAEKRRLADALRWAERYRQRQAEVHLAQARVAALGRPQAMVKPPEAAAPAQPQLPPKQAAPQQPGEVKLAAAAGEPALPPQAQHRPSGRPAWTRRTDAHRAGRSGCPFLRWLQAVVAPPTSPRGPT